MEGGSGLTHDMSHSRPADVLVRDWAHGKLAAFDIPVTSPLFWLRQARRWEQLSKLLKEENMLPMTLNVLSCDGCVCL